VRFYLRMHSGYALKIFCAFLPNLISGAPLFDDLVGTREKRFWNAEPDRLRGLEHVSEKWPPVSRLREALARLVILP
jgi:hypothetical protein